MKPALLLHALSTFVPIPMTLPRTTITPHGQMKFQFAVPDNAAFFCVLTP